MIIMEAILSVSALLHDRAAQSVGRSVLRMFKRWSTAYTAWRIERRAMVVVDVRGTDEFAGPLGHIATSRNIPVAELNTRLAELSGFEHAPVILVCRTDKRSAAAARILRAAGFTQISVLRRGMEQWNTAGLPI